MAHDTGCIQHELLKLRIRVIVFKTVWNRQYEVLVYGMAGSKHIPLIDSTIHQWLLGPWITQSGNLNAILICGIGKSLGRVLDIKSLYKIYTSDYKKSLFPKLLENNISLEDKQKIRGLLNKSWNPDIRQALNTSYSHWLISCYS